MKQIDIYSKFVRSLKSAPLRAKYGKFDLEHKGRKFKYGDVWYIFNSVKEGIAKSAA